ncbi:MAG: stage II sporulation protein M [Ferruginibacter sp.]|nr:stage II sporulation protein M [Bacteroidota bacterium]MBX2920371.1 stage II sporulation protein M [Ferruginibacter sp.]MCB0709373.1 stage II sporulation protein M [Chitinophagaceae bacterium]
MREALFIKKNADKWNKYQHEPTDNPDETAERFINLIDDLSYAKTFYPKSKATRWVNGIAASIYQGIYKNKKEKYSRIFQFWKFELPLLFKKYHRIFLFTTCTFILFTAIGVFSSIHNEDFIRGVLGDGYVNMTEENIAKGDPFGVYKDGNPFSMFIWIGFNNISVAFKAFVGGFTLGLFTLMIMWGNGIMLGAFQYMFFAKGLGVQSVLVIWIHGTLEISAIVISATAGFVLAAGILFPGTYSRSVSFKRNAKDAAKILISLVPIFIVAAFFESYVTHLMSQSFSKNNSAGLPVWASITILVSSLLFIIWYFVILPIRLHKKGYYIQPDGIINRLKNNNA